jgi:hypothetical protein
MKILIMVMALLFAQHASAEIFVEPGLTQYDNKAKMFTFCTTDPELAQIMGQDFNAPCITMDAATAQALVKICSVTLNEDLSFKAIVCSENSDRP